MDLTDTLAIVTGGASGLGRAAAAALVERGVDVVIVDRSASRGEAVAAEIGARFARADVTEPDSVQAAIDSALARARGPLRLVVNCAGGGQPPTPLLADDGTPHDLDSWSGTLALNVTGTFNVTRLAAAAMAAEEPVESGLRGVVVTVSSVAAFQGPPNLVAYATAKSAIVGFTRAASHDLARFGIRVVGIAPGSFRTPPMERFAATAENDFEIQATAPVRFGEPSEFAALVGHIAENDFLNGSVIRLDAGEPGGW